MCSNLGGIDPEKPYQATLKQIVNENYIVSTGKLNRTLACFAVNLNCNVFLDPKFAKLEEMPQSYIEKVKTMHESGGHGSQG